MTLSRPSPDIRSARLSAEQYARNFCDAHAPLTPAQARIEAERCYYCFDAPCTTACPTHIDVPSFVRRIAEGNPRGAAQAILEANPLGGTCARVCPTEVLCEQACVRNTHETKPVEIGLLQRFATDHHFAHPGQPMFTRAAASGRQVAVVGAGPAGLACAHTLARLGHGVVLFDANPKLGGLNEYGLATYKTNGRFSQQEIDWLLSIGGIEVRQGQRLGTHLALEQLVAEYDAVFLGMGLPGVNAIGIPEPAVAGLRNAVEFIAELRQTMDFSSLAIGRRVLVIGGGMTAIDAAVQSRKLGAEEVTIVYRRGQSDMPASEYEQQWAQKNGVRILTWASPAEVLHQDGHLTGMRFAHTRLDGEGRLTTTGEGFELPADMVLKAIGQSFTAQPLGALVELKQGRIATDGQGQTSHPKIWAGGDCRHGGLDLTVDAVEHGKQAALAMHARFGA